MKPSLRAARWRIRTLWLVVKGLVSVVLTTVLFAAPVFLVVGATVAVLSHVGSNYLLIAEREYAILTQAGTVCVWIVYVLYLCRPETRATILCDLRQRRGLPPSAPLPLGVQFVAFLGWPLRLVL